jgi:hypothetical protein
MLNPGSENPNLFASISEAHAPVCLHLNNSALSKPFPASITRLDLSLSDSLAHLSTQDSPLPQALFLFCALKTHTFKIVRGI